MGFVLGLVALIVIVHLAVRLGRLEEVVRTRQPDTVGEALAARVRALEKRLAVLERPGAAASTERLAEESMAPQEPDPPPKRKGLDLEILIAGRWLNAIGILALIFGVAFFLKYAFDNDWFGPRTRVGIGLVIGAVLVASSGAFLGRGYRYFSEGIAGLGGAVLFLSVYAAWNYYRLCDLPTAFVLLVGVSGLMGTLAVRRDSERIALVALVGGFLTPGLLLSPFERPIVLFTYLGVLDLAILVLGGARQWRSFAPLGFCATQLFFWRWYASEYSPAVLVPTASLTVVFHALFAAPVALRTARRGRVGGDDLALLLLDVGTLLLIFSLVLMPAHRGAFALVVLGLGAAYLAVARIVPARGSTGAVPPRALFGGLALAFATFAIPIWLEGRWVTVAFAAEGLILVRSGFGYRVRWLRSAGEALLALAACTILGSDLVGDGVAGAHVFWNGRFAAFVVVIACIAVAVAKASANRDLLGAGEIDQFAVLAVSANGLGLLALSLEIWDLFGRMATNGPLAQQLGLSVLWTAYASVLIALGIRRGLPPLRWQALVLFAVVIGKVFLLDLSYLERGYRIASFVVLGLVLVVVSFLYQRALAARTSSELR